SAAVASPLGSPLAPDLGALRIPAGSADDFFRAAFRIWATELRPKYSGRDCGCTAGPGEGCLLLAELAVPLTPDLKVSDTLPVEVREERRPVLLSLRLLQELLTPAGAGGGGPAVELPVTAGRFGVVAAGTVEFSFPKGAAVNAAGTAQAKATYNRLQ